MVPSPTKLWSLSYKSTTDCSISGTLLSAYRRFGNVDAVVAAIVFDVAVAAIVSDVVDVVFVIVDVLLLYTSIFYVVLSVGLFFWSPSMVYVHSYIIEHRVLS